MSNSDRQLASPPILIGIEVVDLSFSYGSVHVFDKVKFAIPPGEVWGLIGRSGIGKSTLLNVILGLFASDSGSVTTARGRINRPGLIRGVVFQEESLLWWLTVIENMLFPNHQSLDDASVQRATSLLAAAGLAQHAGSYPKQLSTGMRRRIELARALLMDNEYFVADEPFSAVDVQTRLGLYSVWRNLRSAHARTGIISTHDPLEAAITCDAVMVMRNVTSTASIEVLRVPEKFKEEKLRDAAFSDPFVAKLVEKMT